VCILGPAGKYLNNIINYRNANTLTGIGRFALCEILVNVKQTNFFCQEICYTEKTRGSEMNFKF